MVLDVAQLEALLTRTFSIGLDVAAGARHGLIELAEMTGRSGRTGKTDLN